MRKNIKVERAILRKNMRDFKATESYFDVAMGAFAHRDGGACRSVLVGNRNVYKFSRDGDDCYNENEIKIYEKHRRFSTFARIDTSVSNYDKIVMEKCVVKYEHEIKNRWGRRLFSSYDDQITSKSGLRKRSRQSKSLRAYSGIANSLKAEGTKRDRYFSEYNLEDYIDYVEKLRLANLITDRQKRNIYREISFIVRFNPSIFRDMHDENFGFKGGHVKMFDYAGYGY